MTCHLRPPPLTPTTICRDKECPKNHIEHFTMDEEGEDGAMHTIKGATMHIHHHKVGRRCEW